MTGETCHNDTLRITGQVGVHLDLGGRAGRNAERSPSSQVLGEYLQRCVWKVPTLNVRPIEVMPTGMEYMDVYKKLPELNTRNREGR